MVGVLIADMITLKHCPAPELAAGIGLWELRPLARLEDPSQVNCFAFTTSLSDYVTAFTDALLIPNTLRAKVFPFFFLLLMLDGADLPP